MHASPLAALVLSSAAALAACGKSGEAVEAERVVHAIDALRDAPSAPLDARAALLKDLEQQPAKSPMAARAKEACLKAYRLLVDAEGITERLRALHDSGQKPGPDQVRDLDDADAKIKASTESMPACDRAVVDLRLAFK